MGYQYFTDGKPGRAMSQRKGTVAEGGRRRADVLVNRNNIRFTVAFAESYQKNEWQGEFVLPSSF
ncbi:MAG: hypothetical protein IJT66_02535 [Clostridia bacterium]|nr:hypothetical protein [Clostridia bacterium]